MNTQKVAETARFWAEQVHSSAAKALNDAADTIARLTAERDDWQASSETWRARLKSLEEENERLKAMLARHGIYEGVVNNASEKV